MIRVLIWNEYRHEKCQPEVAKIYPQGMHAAIGEYLMQDEDIIVKLACLDDPEQGLSEEALAETDVLIWWGHMAHDEVTERSVERVWTVVPSHPIAQGVPEQFELPMEEMYGEPFDIPTPDEVVFMGWFAGGEVFRSGVTYRRGAGRIFYFQPGHEEYPTFRNKNVLKIIRNAVHWAKPEPGTHQIECTNPAPLEG